MAADPETYDDAAVDTKLTNIGLTGVDKWTDGTKFDYKNWWGKPPAKDAKVCNGVASSIDWPHNYFSAFEFSLKPQDNATSANTKSIHTAAV